MGDYYTDVYPMEEAFMASLGKSVASLLEVGEDAIDILEIGSGNIIGRAEREDFFEHSQNAQIQIHPRHAESLIRAFAFHWYIL